MAGISEETDRRKKREFYTDLEQFYRRKWNAPLKIPHISGRTVDFYALYQKVTSMGGWSKVSHTNRWNTVLEAVDFPTGCAGAEHAVKLVYMRYLARYEQTQNFGEADTDECEPGGSSSNISSRSQRGRLYLSSLSGQAGPINKYASSEYFRSNSNAVAFLSGGGGIAERSQCERLIRSLKSGLPNEVDFALNVCTILSNPTTGCRASFQTCDAPLVIDLLLAHIGIFDEGTASFRNLYEDSWKKYTPGRKFSDFWSSQITGEDGDILALIDAETSSHNLIFGPLEFSFDDYKIVMKRVEQVTNILRNLSFESDFRGIMGNGRTILKYLLVAINCRCATLQSTALDTLSNVAAEMNLDEMDHSILRLLMRTLSQCLFSQDKFHVIRALETIGNLCCNERNEAVLCDFFEPAVLRRLIALLAVKDIMMCVYLLECLYQMTEMGLTPCQRIVEQPKAIDTLVHLVTVEAVSFGPNGLLGMKVVEYGMPTPHTAILPHPTKCAPTVPVRGSETSAYSTPTLTTANCHPASPVLRLQSPDSASSKQVHSVAVSQPPPPFLARPVRPVIPNATPVLSSGSPPIRQPLAATVSPRLPDAKTLIISDATAQMGCRKPTVAVQQDQHMEQLTATWLRQNCAADPLASVSRGELFASYVQDMRRLHDSTAVSVTSFTNLIRHIFPSCHVRQLENANSRASLLQFDGLKFNIRNHSSVGPASPQSQSSVLAAQHPIMQQILTGGGNGESSSNATKNSRVPIFGATPISVPPKTPVAAIARNRSDSVGTMDSGYSVPGTPDSVSSNFSGTNSSLGQNYTNFAGLAHPVSPKSPRSTKSGGKRASSAKNSNFMVNGSVGNNNFTNSTPCVTQSVVCQLEVCHPAQEARTVIETGDTHEARIVRVENTIAMVSSQFYQPAENSNSNPAIMPVSPKSLNGTLSSGCAGEFSPSSPDNSHGSFASTSKMNFADNGGVAYQNATPLIQNSNTKIKKTYAKKKIANGPLNGVTKPLDEKLTALLEQQHRSSASPDTEAIKQNVSECQRSIQELLSTSTSAGGIKTEQAAVDGEITQTGKKKSTSKNGKTPKKRKGSAVSADAESSILMDTETPQPKKKKYTKKKKAEMMAALGDNECSKSPGSAKGNAAFFDASVDVSNGQFQNSVILTVAGAGSPLSNVTAALPFRSPLPPVQQSPMAVQIYQNSVVGPNGQQQIIARIPQPPVGRLKYMCEWDGCGNNFDSANAVYYHVAKHHIDEGASQCRWPRCDQTARLRWSLISHCLDVHCNENVLRAASMRRYEIAMCGHSSIPEARPPPPHPGYPPEAAVAAIRSHALVNLPKDVTEENEGPVTRSIRLTSSLILRNLARYSAEGRRIIRKHEAALSFLAFSRLESSIALAQCLSELNPAASTGSHCNS